MNMDELVTKLSEGRHPVEVVLRAERSAREFLACIERRFVHIKFTGTRGGTELGVPLDWSNCAIDRASFDAGRGQVHLEGLLQLNFVPVRCVADVDVAALSGTGRLEVQDGHRRD
jgi:hypothetical protein